MIKIAFPTDDGVTISQHLGQARQFTVAALADTGQPALEQRAKPYHGDGVSDQQPGQGLGQIMFQTVTDCQVVVAGGMGQPAYDRAVAAGLSVILTGERTIAGALSAYQAGTLATDMRRVHAHMGTH
jgi:predicted Fe-Mo cluster-binding NifX family protein